MRSLSSDLAVICQGFLDVARLAQKLTLFKFLQHCSVGVIPALADVERLALRVCMVHVQVFGCPALNTLAAE